MIGAGSKQEEEELMCKGRKEETEREGGEGR